MHMENKWLLLSFAMEPKELFSAKTFPLLNDWISMGKQIHIQRINHDQSITDKEQKPKKLLCRAHRVAMEDAAGLLYCSSTSSLSELNLCVAQQAKYRLNKYSY